MTLVCELLKSELLLLTRINTTLTRVTPLLLLRHGDIDRAHDDARAGDADGKKVDESKEGLFFGLLRLQAGLEPRLQGLDRGGDDEPRARDSNAGRRINTRRTLSRCRVVSFPLHKKGGIEFIYF